MLLDISYNTYRNWEIGHRNPCTSAVALLTLPTQNPKLFLKINRSILNNNTCIVRRIDVQ